MSNELGPRFWQERFDSRQTGWDRGEPSPQLRAWLESSALTPCRLAVPGCGAGWEVAELARRGFEVVGIDFTEAAVARTRARCQALGVAAEVVQADVLAYTPAKAFDAVYEQTCLCALPPESWLAYEAQLQRWLRPGGRLWALFMQVLRPAASEEGWVQGPPFHCDINAMRAVFAPSRWQWPDPPHARVPHPNRGHELALSLLRR